AQADFLAARERVINKQLAVVKKQQAERAKEGRREERAANAQLKREQKKQLELEKEAQKVAKEAVKLRKKLKQSGKGSGRRRGGVDISLSARSVSQSPTRPLYSYVSAH
ncbi:MAG: hypothetical protein MMC33_008304, partial [Icmadophila ericetorum]|nr:hypothetical protein [Icmadophila ericetorum]